MGGGRGVVVGFIYIYLSREGYVYFYVRLEDLYDWLGRGKCNLISK